MSSRLDTNGGVMTDAELLQAFHDALRAHEASLPGSSNRIRTFVELASAEVALISRFGENYLQRYAKHYSN